MLCWASSCLNLKRAQKFKFVASSCSLSKKELLDGKCFNCMNVPPAIFDQVTWYILLNRTCDIKNAILGNQKGEMECPWFFLDEVRGSMFTQHMGPCVLWLACCGLRAATLRRWPCVALRSVVALCGVTAKITNVIRKRGWWGGWGFGCPGPPAPWSCMSLIHIFLSPFITPSSFLQKLQIKWDFRCPSMYSSFSYVDSIPLPSVHISYSSSMI